MTLKTAFSNLDAFLDTIADSDPGLLEVFDQIIHLLTIGVDSSTNSTVPNQAKILINHQEALRLLTVLGEILALKFEKAAPLSDVEAIKDHLLLTLSPLPESISDAKQSTQENTSTTTVSTIHASFFSPPQSTQLRLDETEQMNEQVCSVRVS
jgi:hypothetical protein